MQEALLHLSVNAYPYAGSEASDPYPVACPPTKFSASWDRGMHLRMGTFRTFHGGPRLQSSSKLGVVPSCEDYWSDASLSMPEFATPSEQSEGIESSKISKGSETELNFTPVSSDEELARQESSFTDRLDDVLPDADDEIASFLACDIDEDQREEKRSVMDTQYDIFPPPIVSPTKCSAYTHLPSDMQRVRFRSIKKDGRFILQELPVSAPQRYLRAERGNGRLRLQLIDIEPFEAQAGPAEEREEEQYEKEEAEEEAEEEEDEIDDEAEVEQEDHLYAFAAISEFAFDGDNEYANGDDAEENSIQQLTALSSKPVASWVTTRGFLHESINRIRPLVY